jgi:hypothetical protein
MVGRFLEVRRSKPGRHQAADALQTAAAFGMSTTYQPDDQQAVCLHSRLVFMYWPGVSGYCAPLIGPRQRLLGELSGPSHSQSCQQRGF